MITDVKIRAFRATDDWAACRRFIEGHKRVLENHGIDKVTSSNDEWASMSSVFVIVVETLDGQKLFGGARIHAADGIHPLPIESAVGDMDPAIYPMVSTFARKGTGEICGLWNSKEVAGLGIGAIFSSRAAVVIAEQIGLDTLFSLCSPVTLKFCEYGGSRVIYSLGNEGTFYYPKINLLATAVCIYDTITLPDTHPMERRKVFQLRHQLQQIESERSPFRTEAPEIMIHYELVVAGANPDEFKVSY